ncbi:alpha-glucuronidase [Catellatospora chokoriensis]|uniref:Xylan alpha-(1->2)-glucuronosidase n=1 Tax=Catellatospora chokoriensis TaxID=310353 RepID=A0A8J3JUK0_9ACTN|nr:alpha-glucuronidase [Catellatospora chokoriensis]GIF91341.1 xylan alpha-(1->2)-glucuronosidase [Catellatospora chokoriensis]
MTGDQPAAHPAWLPDKAFRTVGSRHVLVCADGPLAQTVAQEVAHAAEQHGGSLHHRPAGQAAPHPDGDNAEDGSGTEAHGGTSNGSGAAGEPRFDLVLALTGADDLPEAAAMVLAELDWRSGRGMLGAEGFALGRRDGVTVVLADEPAGLLHGLFQVVRLGETAFGATQPIEVHHPVTARRMLNHWDNIDAHPVMGQVERGYSGGSIFWRDGGLTPDLGRVRAYARLLASIGVNAVTVNNVNVHATEARLLTDRLGDVAALAEVLRPYGIRTHLSVNFNSPVALGGLPTADPLDDGVRAWWADTTRQVYAAIPDFGGYVVKADSEGQPGPFGYGRTHADGANTLAAALEPFGGVVHWRAFVYNHTQDWRDRSTDRARAAYDHFAPLDGQFAGNVILQVKYGPIDFQTREPVSPVIAAMPGTRLAVELQVTQEYTGQQRHVCYLGPLWHEVLAFEPWGDGRTVAAVAAGRGADNGPTGFEGGLVAVSNVGDDPFWTGHPLAQANLYAFGRLAWNPHLDPAAVLDEWIDLTFAPAATADPGLLRQTLHEVMDGSWQTYESYTAPLGVGFMVRPGSHYGPDVDGYEYTPWGTYHFADRDGIGVDRSRATGTGFTGQYPQPWAQVYESADSCPDELLLFFHHVPYTHVLHSGKTVVQHIYDTHFEGADRVARMRSRWAGLAGLVAPDLDARVRERLDEQSRCAQEWRDQINTYFYRKSGIPDAHGRRIH